MEQGEISYCIWERDPSEMSPRNFPGVGWGNLVLEDGCGKLCVYICEAFLRLASVAHDSKQTLETPCPSVREQWSSQCPSSLNHGATDLF